MKSQPTKPSDRPPTRGTRSGGKPSARRKPGANAADVLGRAPGAAFPAGGVPARWRWHYRVLLSLQSRLLRTLGGLRHNIAEQVEPHRKDESDSATDELDHDLSFSQLTAEQDALYEVTEALRRIDAGTYGICEGSGQPIPAERLRAVPWTRFAREVEEQMEKQGLLRGAHLAPARTVHEEDSVRLAPEEDPEEVKGGATPNDEARPHVFSPPRPNAAQLQASPRERKAPKRKLLKVNHEVSQVHFHDGEGELRGH